MQKSSKNYWPRINTDEHRYEGKVYPGSSVFIRGLICLFAFAALTEAQTKIDSAVFGALEARAIGPATTGGRITSIDGVNKEPRTIYVGTAGGGVWKTTNGGVTFKPVFDRYTQSIGAVAVDQAKPETVWVGTGESWTRNSVSVGTGVYKSTDSGENWQLTGLKDSEHIAHIAVDPKNSDTVYVAALGHLWSAGGERGLYKTTDGGRTWNRVLDVPEAGCSDVAIDPQENGIVYAAMWQVRRYPWAFESGGPASGLYRSADGGKTWEKLKVAEGTLGRIAVAIAPTRPNVVYAAVEAKGKNAVYRSDDMGKTWTERDASPMLNARPFYFSLLVPDPKDYNRIYKTSLNLFRSNDGGKAFGILGGFHSDTHALWIDPGNTNTLYLGTDGGVYRSNDAGASWQFLRNLPVGQFYHVTYDMAQPYNVYGGLQDNGSWTAPSLGHGGVRLRDWRVVGMGDGFHAFADPRNPDVVYSEYQGGKALRYSRATGELKSIQPFAGPSDPKYRFNWNTPFVASPNDPAVIYIGAQFVFRSRDRGESWERISPDLSTNDPAKQKQLESGGLTVDNSTAENHCTLTVIAESPLDRNVIWAGTDDGSVQYTRDGGKTWINAGKDIPGLPANTWVSSIEPGRLDRTTAFATFDGHQTGDMKTYVYRTSDFGKTWVPIAGEGMDGFAHVIRQDLKRADLLFAGTETGLYVTIDGGRQWARFTGNLPPVPVRDLAIHPRESDLIVATHGRGIYIIDDITPLRQLTPQVLDAPLTVLETRPYPLRQSVSEQTFGGSDEFDGANPRDVAYVTYYLKERQLMGDFKVEIYDSAFKLAASLPGGTRRGINRVDWPMRLKAPNIPPNPELGALPGPLAAEGTYQVKIIRGDQTYTSKVELVGDPTLPHTAEDRRLQHETLMRVYNALARLADLDAQVVKAKRDDLHRRLISTNPNIFAFDDKLREELGSLYSEVVRYGGRPTRSQIDRAATLDVELKKFEQEFQTAR
jgi:photosystem II stability/assembly factor-like uncharacterized protein